MRNMSQQRWRAYLPHLIGGAVLLLVVAGAVYMAKGSIDSPVKPPRKIDIQVLVEKYEPPPPPEVKQPELKKIIEEKQQVVEIPPEEGRPVKQTPQGDPLKTTMGPGSDVNGLPPGSGGNHIGEGGAGSRARWYASLLASRIEQTLNHDSKLLDELKAKRITVRVWVGDNGRVERVEWDKGSVPAKSEQVLRDQLLTLTMQETPDGVQQPIWYRFRPRG